MKVLKIVLAIVILGSLSFMTLSCGSDADSASESAIQTATVSRGDLTVEITASGNLELSVMEDLAFEMAGTVEEVLVEAGDSVTEGQVLARLDTSEWEDDLASLEMSLLEAEINLENAELDLEEAEDDTYTYSTGDIATRTTDPKEIDILELKVDKAEYTYNKAKEALEEAQSASPEVVAPFDGFITSVNDEAEGGDEILKGTRAVTIADPNKFEAEIYVSELDIVDVELGNTASVAVDALDITVPATVTHISPTATIQSGVVNYTVRVELEPLETLIQEQREAIMSATPDTASDELPDFMQQAIDAGKMTQEEAEAQLEQMQQQMQQAQAEQLAALENIQLREGLTVTVSLVVEEATDVLLVPNGAITTQGGQAYVQMMLADGTIEQRSVTVGISDWQYTEVADGLSEGEEVVVPEGTSTTTETDQFGPPGGGMMMPGMGGIR